MNITKMWRFNKLSQFDINLGEPINLDSLSLNIGNAIIFKPANHLSKRTQISFSIAFIQS